MLLGVCPFMFLLQMCEYAMTVSTPLVCSKHLEEASLQRLDELGVFGFSGSANSNNANSNSNSHKNSGKEQKKKSGGSGGAGSSKKGGTTSKGKGGDQSANHGKHT